MRYAPHTETGYVAPPNKTLLLLLNGALAKRGRARRPRPPGAAAMSRRAARRPRAARDPLGRARRLHHPRPRGDRPMGHARPDRRPVGMDDQARAHADLPRLGLRRRRLLLLAHVPREALAPVLGGRARRLRLRGADADRDAASTGIGSITATRRSSPRSRSAAGRSSTSSRPSRSSPSGGATAPPTRRARARRPELPPGVLLAARAFAVGRAVAGGLFFLSPETAIDIWPWKLTPLTARVLASFTVQVGVGALVLSLDSRWSAWRLIVQTFFVATALLLVGAVRALDDFDTENVMTYLYIGGSAATDLALLALYVVRGAAGSGPRTVMKSGAIGLSLGGALTEVLDRRVRRRRPAAHARPAHRLPRRPRRLGAGGARLVRRIGRGSRRRPGHPRR